MIPWYEKSFGPQYLGLYAHRDDNEARRDIQAIVDLLSPPRSEPLLDLGCGAGRHLRALRDMGFTQLVGLDLSEALLKVAAQDLAHSGHLDGYVHLVWADMRAIPYVAYFATVLSLFTSFGYFAQDEENRAVLDAAYSSLRSRGTFLVDYMNRDYVVSHLVACDEKFLGDQHIKNARCLTHDTRRVEKKTTITTRAGSEHEFHESVRLYSAEEMRAMLQDAGFANIRAYGSLEGTNFSPASPRLVMVAEKGESR